MNKQKRVRELLSKSVIAVATALACAGAHAQWSTSITDMGVQYTLTDLGGSSTYHAFSLLLDTTGYNHHAAPSYLDSVDIKAWTNGSNAMSFALLSAPGGTTWSPTEGPISSGPVGNTGCGGSGAGFACVEADTKGVLNVLSGNPYAFFFGVTLNGGSFLTSAIGAHIGAGYAGADGTGASYGITSREITSPIPEPETYALMLAGLGLLGLAARRRKRKQAAAS